MASDSSGDGFEHATTMARPRPRLAETTSASFRVLVTEGESTGLCFDVTPDLPARLLLGKGPACDVQLKDPEASRRHATMDVVGHRLCLTDLDSTNGTFVNGLSIGTAYLTGGEQLTIGSTVLRVELSSDAAVAAIPFRDSFGRLSGASLPMRRLYALCERLAFTEVPVVIEGETGTGKEQLAEALHAQGPRAQGPFVVFDCTAVTPNLIESELFGHERGAFTGSTSVHRGVFERANAGTLLVDEIGDLPNALQAKLLRVIQRSQVTRVGGERTIDIDVRLLFATRRDLDKEVQEGRFRDDLFHRIAVARIELPPLRARHGDVTLLATRFWKELGGDPKLLTASVLAAWEAYAWPGNVRELRNAVMRRIALGDLGDLADGSEGRPGGKPHTRAALSQGDTIARILAQDPTLEDARNQLRSEFEARYIAHALEQGGGNVGRAAAFAGVAHRHFQRIKAKYDGQ